MATTPPPVSPSAIHTPPTPKHGAKLDSWEPYSVRRSTRSLTRKSKDNNNKQDSSSLAFSPPSSTESSPTTSSTRMQVDEMIITTKQTGRSVSTEAMKGTSTGLLRVDDDTATMGPTTTMLPTPAKTPRKRPQEPAHALRSTARVLFPARDEITGKRRGGRRLDDSMNGANGDDPIEIYTDSKDRIPTLDISEDNPFWDHGNQEGGQSTGLNGGVKRKATVAKNEEIEKAVKRRDDGIVYVFRGKKIFRKFDEEEDEEDNGSVEAGDILNGHARTRPFTRSSIAPRLLFPTEEQRREREQRAQRGDDEVDVDEEAITDIDEEALNKKPMSATKSFHEEDDDHVATEVNHPTSVSPNDQPPTTASPLTPTSPSARTTRSGAKREAVAAKAAGGQNNHRSPFEQQHEHVIPATAQQGPRKKNKKKTTSPFNDWQRTKSSFAGKDDESMMSMSKKGKNKRQGETLDTDTTSAAGPTAKKMKLAAEGGKM
ncbi:MAG: hypothetical protein M1816_001541 [Peltula sp. TS41687]|nr:MAG: hypothetical protein M1816_001541 [Peltula sp. TS41687]